MKFVVGGIVALIAMIMILPQLHLQWNLLGAMLIVAFGFLVRYRLVAADG